ncbi:ATP-binding protein [Frankia sp. KB5]|nr:ATP-binding protein [Frankia sp. KB5]
MTGDSSPVIRVAVAHFPPTAAAVPDVRTSTACTLREWSVDSDTVNTVELVVCELTSNAVKASRPEDVVAIRLTATGEYVLVEVRDGNDTAPRIKSPDLFSEDGSGLLMVDALSRRWSWWRVKTGGKVVWAEIPGGLQATPPPTQAATPMPTRTPRVGPQPTAPVVYRTDPETLRRVADALRALDPWHRTPSGRSLPEAVPHRA